MTKNSTNKDTKMLTVNIPVSLFEQFKEGCKEDNLTMSEAIKGFIQSYLDGNLEAMATGMIGNNTTAKQIEEAVERKFDDYISKELDQVVSRHLETDLDVKLDSLLEKKLDNYLDSHLEAKLKLDNHLDNDIDGSLNESMGIPIDQLDNEAETPPSDLPPESTKEDKPYQLTLKEDKPPEKVKNDQSENEAQKADDEGLSATELAGLLDIPKGYISNWKKGKNIPSEVSKYHSAYHEWRNWEQKGSKWYRKPTS